MDSPMRINKYLAHAGIATRRGADALIETGKVFVNGKKAVIGQQVTEKDRIEIRDHEQKTYRYLLYYKPQGVITHSPAQGEVDIVTRVRDDHGVEGVFPIGRLDKDSEGLILLTDDGRITNRLLSPEFALEREFEVTVDKRVTGSFLKRLTEGVRIEDFTTKPSRVTPDSRDDHRFTIVLPETKKHQLRRMCAALGYQVESQKRVRIGELKLGTLKRGQYRALNAREAARLRASLGLT